MAMFTRIGRSAAVVAKVAVVVAVDPYIASDAIAAIEVDYDPLPAVVDPEKALEPGAPVLHDNAPAYDGAVRAIVRV